MKIDLSTLAQASAQQVFDHVAKALYRQGFMRARQVGRGGRRSVIGHCMSLSEYHSLERVLARQSDERQPLLHCSWTYLVERQLVPSAHAELIQQLEDIYQQAGVDEEQRDYRECMQEQLRACANARHLSAAALDGPLPGIFTVFLWRPEEPRMGAITVAAPALDAAKRDALRAATEDWQVARDALRVFAVAAGEVEMLEWAPLALRGGENAPG